MNEKKIAPLNRVVIVFLFDYFGLKFLNFNSLFSTSINLYKI